MRDFSRYVDDCYMLLPKDKIQYTLNKFSNFLKALKFTLEENKQNYIKFPFLYLIITALAKPKITQIRTQNNYDLEDI